MAYLGITSEPYSYFGANKKTIQKARELKKKMTPAETLLWSALRNNGLHGLRFRRQHPIGQYIADFFCLKHLLVIEIDGGSHIGKEKYDEVRSGIIRDHGLTILRFTNEEVLHGLAKVLQHIIASLSDK